MGRPSSVPAQAERGVSIGFAAGGAADARLQPDRQATPITATRLLLRLLAAATRKVYRAATFEASSRRSAAPFLTGRFGSTRLEATISNPADQGAGLKGKNTAGGESYLDVAGVVGTPERPLEFVVVPSSAIRTEKIWRPDEGTPVLDDGIDAPRDCGSAYRFRQKLVRASVNGLLEVTQLGIGSNDNQRQMPNFSFWPLANLAAEFDAAEMRHAPVFQIDEGNIHITQVKLRHCRRAVSRFVDMTHSEVRQGNLHEFPHVRVVVEDQLCDVS